MHQSKSRNRLPRGRGRGRRRLLAVFLAAVLAAACAVAPAFLWAPAAPRWLPGALKTYAQDVRLAISRPLLAALALRHAVAGEPSVFRPPAAETLFLESDGLRIACELHGTGSAGAPRPAVVLVHGSTPRGRRLGLYRLLAGRLAARGYAVLLPDLRGWGQSQDPVGVDDPAGFDFTADVAAAVAYLRGRPDIDPRRIYLVGHSFGADVALSAAAGRRLPVAALVLIGPARRFWERGGTPEAPEFDYFRRRDFRFMKLAAEPPAGVFAAYRARLTIENHAAYLLDAAHVPILFVDGGRESLADRRFLERMYRSAAAPKAYRTIAGADHYLNTADVGPLVVYDRQPLAELIGEMEKFFASHGGGTAGGGTAGGRR